MYDIVSRHLNTLRNDVSVDRQKSVIDEATSKV